MDSVGSDAIGQEADIQNIQFRCKTTQAKGEISHTGGGDTHASGSPFRRKIMGRVTIPAMFQQASRSSNSKLKNINIHSSGESESLTLEVWQHGGGH